MFNPYRGLTLEQVYARILDEMIREVGGDLGDVEWTPRDGTKAKFRDLSLVAVQTMHRYFRIQHQAAQDQHATLLEQIDLQKLQNGKLKSIKPSIPDGIQPGKFKKRLNGLVKQIESLGFTLYVLNAALRMKEKQNLTVSPMLAKMRASANGRFNPKRTPT